MAIQISLKQPAKRTFNLGPFVYSSGFEKRDNVEEYFTFSIIVSYNHKSILNFNLCENITWKKTNCKDITII